LRGGGNSSTGRHDGKPRENFLVAFKVLDGLDGPAALQGCRVVGQVGWDKEFDRKVHVGAAETWIRPNVARSFESLPHLQRLTAPGGFPKIKTIDKVLSEESDLIIAHSDLQTLATARGQVFHVLKDCRVKDHGLVFGDWRSRKRI
jgi:hypothetical protein